jgi:hypothetical protein
MAHRVGNIAWGELDKGIKIITNDNRQCEEVDVKRMKYFVKTMVKSIKEFKDTAVKDNEYDAVNWHNFIAGGGGGQMANISVVIMTYIRLNLFILNSDK